MIKLKVEIKPNKEKLENFQEALQELINSGFGESVYLTEGQTKIYVYMGLNHRAIVLNLNGTWELE